MIGIEVEGIVRKKKDLYLIFNFILNIYLSITTLIVIFTFLRFFVGNFITNVYA